MLQLPPGDDELSALVGTNVGAPGGASYRLERVLGAGGMSIAFFALQLREAGVTPVVLKVTRPSMVRHREDAARMVAEKEATALRRLGERVPPTPFVVRLVDSGALPVQQDARQLSLPWLAIEYVHGGAEGTTLEERVAFSLDQTGAAFEPGRAALAVRCLASGLGAIHEEGVIHRDITPSNVLCCGFGEGEIFKLADFGVARPQGMGATFDGDPVGTAGYAAPEQIVLADADIGPASDVFAFAAVVYRLLTGEDYFRVGSVVDGVVQAQQSTRRTLLETQGLCPELRARPGACAAIDAVLARATAADAKIRPQSAAAFATALLPFLTDMPASSSGTAHRRLKSILSRAPTLMSGWSWNVRHRGGDERVVRSVAWDGDGHCLAATDRGLEFWNGNEWTVASLGDLPIPGGIHFVRRVGAGSWLVGGEKATLARYSTDGVHGVVQGADAAVLLTHASGDVNDLGVLVGIRDGAPPILYGLAARHWLKPATLSRAASISALARLDAERWLVVGRSTAGEGFVVIYSPLLWEVKRITMPKSRAYLACASLPEAGVGIVAGAGGSVARITEDKVEELRITGDPDIAAVDVDAGGRIWAASTSTLWLFDPAAGRWAPAWHDPDWKVPFISISADVGLVIAMTPDGGIVEGRNE